MAAACGYAFLADGDGREAVIQGDADLVRYCLGQLRKSGWTLDVETDEWIVSSAPAAEGAA
jgi:hypothetical protein